jgi:glycosyltransferase involved in cell wall biosynthesis
MSGDKKEKILLVANYRPDTGGISVQVKLLYEHLRSEGYSVGIYSLSGSALKRLVSYFLLIFRILQYDIIHVHACSYRGFMPAVAAVPLSRLFGKKVVLTFHGGDGERYFDKHPKPCRFVFRRTSANIVLSGFLGVVFDKKGYSYVIIPNIVDFDESLYKHRDSISPKYLSLRSLKPEYNIQCIIKAFQIVKQSCPDASLDILGDGPDRRKLEEFVSANSIAGVNFHGNVPNTEVYEWLHNSDVFVSSPLVDNQPMSVMEAFCCGTLVISSNVGGIPYMIEEGVNGYLFESDNVQQLADKMILSVKDQDAAKRIIAKARESLSVHSWEYIKPLLLKTYGIENS